MKNEMTATTKPERVSLMTAFAHRFGMEPSAMMATLKATAFRVKDGEATNEQLAALIVVANEYGLNPFTKEIYAFPDARNGIIPVVGVDGWSRIVNENPNFDGLEFVQTDTECTCIIYRKDRGHPVSVTEYMSECKRGTAPWQSHPKRMLRHKSFIQCARMAFAYTGIFDDDEAARIIDVTPAAPENEPRQVLTLPEYPADAFRDDLAGWALMPWHINRPESGLIAMIETKYTLTDEQRAAVADMYSAKRAAVADDNYSETGELAQ